MFCARFSATRSSPPRRSAKTDAVRCGLAASEPLASAKLCTATRVRARPRGEPQPFDFLVGLVDLRAAFVASARRAKRSFFFCWPLRRVIFSELRLSNRPIVSSVIFLGRCCVPGSRTTRAPRGSPHTVLFPLGKVFRPFVRPSPALRGRESGAFGGLAAAAGETRRAGLAALGISRSRVSRSRFNRSGSAARAQPLEAQPLEASSRARSRSRTSRR